MTLSNIRREYRIKIIIKKGHCKQQRCLRGPEQSHTCKTKSTILQYRVVIPRRSRSESISAALLGKQLNMGWRNPCVPDRHIWARRALGSGMVTADGSVPFCPDQNGDKLEQEQLQDQWRLTRGGALQPAMECLNAQLAHSYEGMEIWSWSIPLPRRLRDKHIQKLKAETRQV